MKCLFYAIFLSTFFNGVSGQTGRFRVGPLNKNFLTSKSNIKSAQVNNQLGYIPFPNNFIYSHHKNQTKSTISLPSSYDLRSSNLITSVKNQGSGQYGGNCWAFAQMGNIESQWLKMGYSNTDLSEQNMITCNGFAWGYGDGGNEMIAFGYLGRNLGPLNETDDPYNLNEHNCITGFSPAAFEPDIQFIDGTDITLVKEHLMQFGALSITMYWSNASYKSVNSATYPNTYYYSGNNDINHMVVLAGWDDTKQTTGGTGAWLIKNSWGTSWGDQGYFYISYHDAKALSTVSFHPTRIEENGISKVFMNDLLGPVNSAGFGQSEAYALVKYSSTTPLTINKIGTFSQSSNTVVNVDVYKKFSNDTLSNLIYSISEKIMPNPGFYLFDTQFDIDSVFFIKARYTSPYNNYPVPIEEKVVDSSGNTYADPVILPSGTQWISGDGIHWQACGNDTSPSVLNLNLSVRAYVSDPTKPIAGFTANKNQTCVGSNVTFYNASNQNATSYLWNFGEGANPQSANTVGPHTVTYSSTGLKDISLTVTGSNGQDSIIKKGYLTIANDLNVFPSYSQIDVVAGKPIVLEAFGADSFKWSPNIYLSADTGKMITVQPDQSITYTVTGKTGICTGSDTVHIAIVTRPRNDDICNADTLKMGDNWTFTNINATVQIGEPHPKEGGCNTPLEWCAEGGLQNSVWFLFIPDESRPYSFITGGMDTQMAIYQANSCDQILSGTYNLLAANDDYFGAPTYAAAINQLPMTAGTKYFIQIDGSGGGVEGNFNLTVSAGSVSTPEVHANTGFTLYPNPNNGHFYLGLPSAVTGNVSVSIIDFTGRTVYTIPYPKIEENNTLQIEARSLPAGLYIIKVKGTDVDQSLKFLIQ